MGAHEYGCFDCPLPGNCVRGFDDEFDCAMCDLSSRVDDDNVCVYDGVNISLPIPSERELQQVIGDFLDQSTSPNDPIFMFHHVNLDRYLMEWQLNNYEQKVAYYNYPRDGYAEGINLDDVMAPDVPFTSLLFGVDSIGDGPYTVREIWDGTSIVDAVYTYDTVLDLIHRSDDEGDSDESGVVSMYLYVNSLFVSVFFLLFR